VSSGAALGSTKLPAASTVLCLRNPCSPEKSGLSQGET
jgi:hypothetical protein